jgi:hypothetical protein
VLVLAVTVYSSSRLHEDTGNSALGAIVNRTLDYMIEYQQVPEGGCQHVKQPCYSCIIVYTLQYSHCACCVRAH